MARPSNTSHPGFFQKYIDLVPENDLVTAFINQMADLESFLGGISEEKSLWVYAPGKWTMREALLHIIDTERVFGYRAMCFARGDKQNLPGFDENEFAAESHANDRTWKDITEELMLVRKATEKMFAGFDETDLAKTGTANNKEVSVLSLGFMTLGHYYHHKNVFTERYLRV